MLVRTQALERRKFKASERDKPRGRRRWRLLDRSHFAAGVAISPPDNANLLRRANFSVGGIRGRIGARTIGRLAPTAAAGGIHEDPVARE